MRMLYRSRKSRMICGVCGGLGEYLKIDPTVIRLLWVLVTFFTAIFGGIVLYIIACAIMPEKPPYAGDHAKPKDENPVQGDQYRENHDETIEGEWEEKP